MVHRFTKRVMDSIQHVISSPYFFFVTIFVTIGWMIYNTWSVTHGQPAIDPPREFFPLTVLIYSLVALWIENAMKVQQREQQDLGQRQLDTIEALTQKLAEGQTIGFNTVLAVQKMVMENAERDEVIHQLISVVDATVDGIEQTADQILRISSLRKEEQNDRRDGIDGQEQTSADEGPPRPNTN